MKIAYIVPALANKGPVLVVKDLVEQMTGNGQQCVVYFFDEREQEISFPCPVRRIRFTERIDFDKFDIVHSHGIRPDLYVFWRKPSICRTKFVSTLHSYVIPDLRYQYNWLVGFIFGYIWIFMLRRHDKVVTLTQHAVEYYKKWISSAKLTFAYNTRCCREKDLKREEKQQIADFRKDFLLISVNAVLTDTKGVDQIIRALPELSKYKMLVVGDGRVKDKLQRLALRLKVEDRVLFVGYHQDAYRFLSYCDVYAMPSRSEGFGLSLLEAAIMGIPAVCSDIPVFREIFSKEEVAFFQLENITSLVEAIKSATANKFMVNRMHQKYLDCYSPEKFYERYISIYQSLL